jgi:RNA polymerase sigma factor (sigma-70 family)
MRTGPSSWHVLRGAIQAPRLERIEESAQIARARNGDPEALDFLIASSIRGVVRIAKMFRGRGVPFDDLIAEGCVGLLHAIRRYNATTGTRFMTYASFWIRKEILTALAEQPNAIHVPQYARQHGYRAHRILRLDLRQDAGSVFSVADRLRHPDPLAADTIIERERSAQVQSEVQRLEPRERAVIVWHYGLAGEPRKTLHEISLSLGLSRERVRQIEVSALAHLRHAMARRSRQKIGQPDRVWSGGAAGLLRVR